MDDRTVRHFLDHVGSSSLLAYLAHHEQGLEPSVALRQRLAWAEVAQRQVGNAHEALMLLEHEALFFERLQHELSQHVIRGDDEHSTAFEPRPQTDPNAQFPPEPSGLTLLEDLTPLPQNTREVQRVMQEALAERDARLAPALTPPHEERVFPLPTEDSGPPMGLRVALTVGVALAVIGVVMWMSTLGG